MVTVGVGRWSWSGIDGVVAGGQLAGRRREVGRDQKVSSVSQTWNPAHRMEVWYTTFQSQPTEREPTNLVGRQLDIISRHNDGEQRAQWSFENDTENCFMAATSPTRRAQGSRNTAGLGR